MPALMIDDKIVSSGKVLKTKEVDAYSAITAPIIVDKMGKP